MYSGSSWVSNSFDAHKRIGYRRTSRVKDSTENGSLSGLRENVGQGRKQQDEQAQRSHDDLPSLKPVSIGDRNYEEIAKLRQSSYTLAVLGSIH